ncbi:MAG TPA: hypothetical protein VLC95_04170, partial [Anaerolineae bacterium]|nr:hypothetical protein [Anaerolineae bacterium]
MYRLLKGSVLVCVVVMVSMLLAGCRAADSAAPELEFVASMQVDSGQRFNVSLGVRNGGDEPFTDYQAFNGTMDLTTAAGERVASITVATLWRLEPGETAWPAAFEGRLEPGAYRLAWLAGDYGTVTVDFTIVELEGWLYLGEERILGPGGEEILGDGEHGALQSLADLARVNLAQDLGMDVESVTVVGVEETEFADASLGVPEEGRAYAQVLTPGYSIRLEAGGTGYEYRASVERLVRVPDGAPAPDPGGSPAAPGRVSIQGVEVVSGEAVRVYGVASLPGDACIETELYAGGEP